MNDMFEIVNANGEKSLKRKEKQKKEADMYIMLPAVEENYKRKHRPKKKKKKKESVLAKMLVALWIVYFTVLTTYLFIILTLFVTERIL
jgi:hypothetical protein